MAELPPDREREDAGPENLVVLRDGIPPCPSVLAPHDEVPVAIWRDGDRAHVLWLYNEPDAWDPEDDIRFGQDLDAFRLVDGVWKDYGGGGSSWPWEYGERPDSGGPQFSGFSLGPVPADGDDPRFVMTGIAPRRARRVGVRVGGYEAEAEVEPVTGAFVIGVRVPINEFLNLSDDILRIVQ